MLTGQRRVGKSYILRQLEQEIKERNPGANIIYINKEKKKFSDIRTDDDVSAYLEDKIDADGSNYLLIDDNIYNTIVLKDVVERFLWQNARLRWHQAYLAAADADA